MLRLSASSRRGDHMTDWNPLSIVRRLLDDTAAHIADQAAIAREASPPDVETVQSGGWPRWDDGPLAGIVIRNRADMYRVLGNPGVGKADKKWERANIVELHGAKAMPGVPGRWYFKVHRLIEPNMREAFRRAAIACPEYEIERAASYVFRHMRHDPKMPLSDHAWGAAVDVDPALNKAITFKPNKTPKPWSAAWMNLWPSGLPRGFVDAFKSCGFQWGGDWKGYCDPMHFQWRGL